MGTYHKVGSVLLVLFLCIHTPFLTFSASENVPDTVDIPPRKNISYIGGIWEPATPFQYMMILFDLNRLKNDGINTIAVTPMYVPTENGELIASPFMKMINIFMIQRARKAGFAVMVVPNEHADKPIVVPSNLSKYVQNLKEMTKEWAEIAEKYNVEFFAPVSELYWYYQNDEIAKQYYEEVIKEIRPIFSGKIIYKIAAYSPTGYARNVNLSGYDIYGIDFNQDSHAPEEWREEVHNILHNVSDIAEKQNKAWMIAELWIYKRSEIAMGNQTIRAGKIIDQYFQLVFEENERVQYSAVGFMFGSWLSPAGSVRNTPAEDVVKHWFTER